MGEPKESVDSSGRAGPVSGRYVVCHTPCVVLARFKCVPGSVAVLSVICKLGISDMKCMIFYNRHTGIQQNL